MGTTQPASVFELAAADDFRVAGRKAATLSRLRRSGFPVPPGVVVAASVRDAALDGAVPPDVAARLVDAVQAWGDVPLAVRSSGVDEDSGETSFAGLFTTVLDVRGPEALLDAVATCWASALAPRVTSYAGESGAGLAVLVQPLVPAVAAGVAFTADPVTGRRDVVVIDAVAGLGERLVSGEATPERWIVDRGGHATRQSTGGDALLDEASAGGIAELARKVEAELGGPQDVEWAIDPAGSVVLLQARPITALPDEPLPVPVEVPEGYWERDTTHDVPPSTPLSASFTPAVNSMMARLAKEFGLLFDGVEVRDIGGWQYMRMVPLGGKEPPPLPKALVPLLPLVMRLAPPVRKRLRDAEKAIREDLPGSLIRRWYEEWQPAFDARNRALRAVRLTELDDAALADHLRTVADLNADGFEVHFRLHGAQTVVLAELSFTCRDLLGWDDAQTLALVSGTSTMSTRPARALADVAGRAGPRVRELLRTSAPVDVVLAADAGFAEAFRSYLEEYCCRVLAYEIAEPSLEERPELVLALVRDQLATGFDPVEMEEDRRHERERVHAAARDRLRGEDLARFERVLERALLAYPVREDNEFYTVSTPQALIRRAVLEVGRRAAGRDLLAAPVDVVMLTYDEVLAFLAEGSLDADLVRRRRRERAWVIAHPGPASFGKPPGPPPSMDKLPAAARLVNGAFLWALERMAAPSSGTTPADGVVSGIPASPGRYTGPVRVVRSESEFDRLRAGDVLVCPQTSPVWSVVFPSVGALVTDHGGTLSHPAIIAREYGIPAVVATGGATAVLREGQVVTVDGTAGTVEVVSGG